MPDWAQQSDRTGLPVPGLTATEVVSQVAWRALGPLGGRAWAVLDWAGTRGSPAARTADVAARYGVSHNTMNAWVRQVRAVGATVPLPIHVLHELQRPSVLGDDQESRRRLALLMTVPPPAPAPRPRSRPTAAQREWARTARRMLASVGPLPIEALVAGVRRVKRGRSRSPLPDAAAIEQALTDTAWARPVGDRWQLTAEAVAPRRYVALLAAAAGTQRDVHTTAQMHELLTLAGYRSVTGPALGKHALIERIDRNQWKVLSPSRMPSCL